MFVFYCICHVVIAYQSCSDVIRSDYCLIAANTTWWQRRDMATLGLSLPLKAPENFDFKKPDEWCKWKRRYEQFSSASGLNKEDEARQISTLLYCPGEEADDVLTATNISDDDRKKFDKVIKSFDDYFKVRKNVIYERARFNRRDQ